MALSEAGWSTQALDVLGSLHAELQDYQPYQAALAELLKRNGQLDESRRAYEAAIALSGSAADIVWLRTRLASLRSP